MFQATVILFFVLAIVHADPRDLVDEAYAQVDELRIMVQGEILKAHDDVDNSMTEFQTYSVNTAQSAEIDIQQQSEDINTRLSSLKALANSANVDISICLYFSEEELNRLPTQYKEQMTTCVTDTNNDGSRIARDAKYTVDVVINKVSQLEFQLEQCNRTLLCISPLLTEIQLSKVRLPQNIRSEVQTCSDFLTILRQSTQNCAEYNVSGYTTDAYSILGDITACVTMIIG